MKHGDKLVMFEPNEFYKAVRSSCIQQGTTQLRAVIYATLALEEIMRDDSCPDKLPILSTIGAVAIPEMERLSPMDERESGDKEAMLDFYETNDSTKIKHLQEAWAKIKKNRGVK